MPTFKKQDLATLASDIGGVLHGDNQTVENFHTRLSTDTRTLKAKDLFIALVGPNFDGHDFVEAAVQKQATALIVSHFNTHIKCPQILVEDTRLALSQLAQRHRQQHHLPMITMTGSCGKTTTKQLTAGILSQAGPTLFSQSSFNNEIGCPLTLLRLNQTHCYAVIELGANQPGEIRALSKLVSPTIVVITNAAHAHIKGFRDLDGVAQAKGEIIEGLKPGGIAILNRDDTYWAYWQKKVLEQNPSARCLSFGMHQQADVSAHSIDLDELGYPNFLLKTPKGQTPIQLNLLGIHNVMNALAAACVAHALDMPLNTIKAGLESCQPVPGRLATLKGLKGIQLIDDTYNANPDACFMALKVLERLSAQHDTIFVLGDIGELGEHASAFHAQIGQQAKSLGIKHLWTCGRLSAEAAKAFGVNARSFDQLTPLIDELKAQLHKNMLILVKGSRTAGMERVIQALKA